VLRRPAQDYDAPGMATLPKAFQEMTQRQKGRVLVIDDDRSIRELLSLHLANRGYDVAVAEDAIVGGKLVLAARPQLIIIDVNMPYMDGPEFVAALRSAPQTSDIPVVFLTSDDEVTDRAKRLGAVACLKKPIMADRLLDIISRAF
jgi:CheY-like chemotaxis protein